MLYLRYIFKAIVLHIFCANILTAFIKSRTDKSTFFNCFSDLFFKCTIQYCWHFNQCQILEFPNELLKIEFNGCLFF